MILNLGDPNFELELKEYFRVKNEPRMIDDIAYYSSEEALANYQKTNDITYKIIKLFNPDYVNGLKLVDTKHYDGEVFYLKFMNHGLDRKIKANCLSVYHRYIRNKNEVYLTRDTDFFDANISVGENIFWIPNIPINEKLIINQSSLIIGSLYLELKFKRIDQRRIYEVLSIFENVFTNIEIGSIIK